MNSSPITMGVIPGTCIQTFCTSNQTANGRSNTYFVYIADVLSEGKLVQIKPISTLNLESIKEAKNIIVNGRLAGIEIKTEGVFLKAFDSVGKAVTKDAKIQVLSPSKSLDLGLVKNTIHLNSGEYKPMINIYSYYVAQVVNAAKNQSASKSAQVK